MWTSRDTADLPPIGLRGGIGTQRANVFRLTPYCGRRWRASKMRYVGEPVDALSFLIKRG